MLSYDFLDVFIYHGVSGFIGTLLAGLFIANPKLNIGMSIAIQIISAVIASSIALFGTLICLIIISIIFNIFNCSMGGIKFCRKKLSCRRLFIAKPVMKDTILCQICCDPEKNGCCVTFGKKFENWFRKPITFSYKDDDGEFLSLDYRQYGVRGSYQIGLGTFPDGNKKNVEKEKEKENFDTDIEMVKKKSIGLLKEKRIEQ